MTEKKSKHGKATRQGGESKDPPEDEPSTAAPPTRSGDGTAPGVTDHEAFPIVGIGASAGGLAALKQLFAHVPADTGLAFVVVVHLSPDHESHLAQILQPHVKMSVRQVTETVRLEPNQVYVIPPNANLDTIDTHLRLSELEERPRERAQIDHFFRTLSATHDDDAIGVVLSGTGSDGTLGLRQIKARGGLTVVQDPVEAEFDSMPQSAISAAPVDLILPLAEIPAAILRFVRTKPRLEMPADEEAADAQTRRFLHKVYALLRARVGRDFTHYKRSTILRRIARRMQFNQIKEPSAYLEFVRDRPYETTALADDLLIPVTSFFRDPEVFDTLAQRVIPQLFDGKQFGDSVRVWSVGCATGEEAYSLAMVLMEEAARRAGPPSIQIFASDLHQGSLEKAREGFYPGDIEADVGLERIGRFFTKENGSYRVHRAVREHVIFAPHNVLADPPFSHLDLISCRNLLIYLDRELHPQVVELFHYALRDDGFLVLGTSENVDGADLFRIHDKKTAIYRRRNVPAPEPRLPVFPLAPSRLRDGAVAGEAPKELPAYETLHGRMLEQQGPASVLVSPDGNIVHSSARAGRYLVHPPGLTTANVVKLIREELRTELRAALSIARGERRSVRTKPVLARCEGEPVSVAMDVRPATAAEHDGFLLLVFDERSRCEHPAQHPGPTKPGGAPSADGDALARIVELEAEKELADQRLHRRIEEHETGQEELKASNEELQSANEELRSTLEELETSKEELQSMNEELQTVNQENRHKVDELDQLSSDLHNLLVATDIATLFLDRDHRILRFTPKIEQLFSIQMTDRGRALSDFTTRLGYDRLVDDARQVLDQLVPIERETRDEVGRWYLTRVLPYRDREDRIAGVVVTFVDITNLKQAEEDVRVAKETSEQIIESLPEPLLVLTRHLQVRSANATFYEHFAVTPEETIGRKLHDLGDRQFDDSRLRELLDAVLSDDAAFTGYQSEGEFEGLGRRVMLLNARRLDSAKLILLGIHDITERYESEQALRESEERFRALVTASSEVVYRISPDWSEMRQLRGGGISADTELSVQAWLEEHVPPEERPRVTAAIDEAIRTRSMFELEHEVRREGDGGWTAWRAVPILNDAGEVVEWFGAASDVTERRAAEERLREADRRKDEYLAMLGHELRNPLSAIRSATELVAHAGPDDERSRRAYDVLQRQTVHMSTIIEGLLDVSRIARGKLLINLAPLDICELVQDVVEVQRSQLPARGFEFEVDVSPEPLWVAGDEARLAQVFDNLIGNAIKFTPSGTITVTCQREADSAVIRVRDTGVGIRPQILATIFEPFHQEVQDVARATGGLGLGLSLARGLVELHRGTIEAHSAGLGHGAEMVVCLPLTAAPSVSVTQKSDEDVVTRRVLVVEDNVDAGLMLRDLLELHGHEVTLVEDGSAALEALRARPVDIALCDVGLPGMSGYELAGRIRNDPALCKLPLVAMTGYGRAEDRERAAEAGFDEHLTKPTDLRVLNGLLKRLGGESE